MRTFTEIKIRDFKTSGITQKALDKKGFGDIKFIKATLNNPKELELLFEVESSTDDPQKTGLKGQDMPNPNKRGYAVIFNFKNLGKEVKPENLKDFILTSECKVHCDCKSFFFQGMQQSNSENGNTKFKFQAKGGKHIWDLKHSEKGGKIGRGFCKHLEVVRDWLLTDSNLKEIKDAITKIQSEKKESIRKNYLKTLRKFQEAFM